ncbi:hypothetical protein D3C80_50520 [compost metagenome]
MSLLQPVIDRLALERNTVMIEDSRRPGEIRNVVAVGLFTIHDEPVQLFFLEGEEWGFEFNGQFTIDPRYSRGDKIQFVTPSEKMYNQFRTGCLGDRKTPDSIFSALVSSNYNPTYVRLLEFAAVKPLYRIHDIRDAREAFEGVDCFVEPNGRIHSARMAIMMENRPGQYREGQMSSNGPKNLEFGNCLIWSGLNTDIHWVDVGGPTRDAVSLGVVGSAGDYNEFLRWTRQFRLGDWVVAMVAPLPMPPITRMSNEPAPPPEGVQTFAMIAASLKSLLDTKEGYIDAGSSAMLSAIFNKHFHRLKASDIEDNIEMLGNAINEAFITVDGVGVKKREQIKTGIISQFREQLESK